MVAEANEGHEGSHRGGGEQEEEEGPVLTPTALPRQAVRKAAPSCPAVRKAAGTNPARVVDREVIDKMLSQPQPS
jgi:hypothetical protein